MNDEQVRAAAEGDAGELAQGGDAMTLTEFLTARLDEDERRWTEPALMGLAGPPWLSDLVLKMRVDIEAKRRIVAHIDNMAGGELTYMERLRLTDIENAQYVGLRDTLRLLALPYAEHPDFRDEWRT